MHSGNAMRVPALDLFAVWQVLWRRKWFIILLSGAIAAGSVFYALSLSNQYRAVAVLQPADASGGLPSRALGGTLGGLASLAGVNPLQSQGEVRMAHALALLETWDFVEGFINKYRLQAEVFAATGWDKNNNIVIYDPDLYDASNKRWVRDPAQSPNGLSTPSSWELFEAFEKKVLVRRNPDNGLVAIVVDHYSPHVAKRWVDLLVRELNLHFQQQDRVALAREIGHLQQQIEATSVTEVKTTLQEVLQQQTQTLMLAEMSTEYALKTLAPAKIAEKKVKPGRAFIVILMSLCGGFLAIALVLVGHRWRKPQLLVGD